MVHQLFTSAYVYVWLITFSCFPPCMFIISFHFITLPDIIYLFHFIEQMSSSILVPLETSSAFYHYDH